MRATGAESPLPSATFWPASALARGYLLGDILGQPLPRPLRADALRLLAEISYNDERAAEARRLFTEALDHAEDPRLAVKIEFGL